MGFLDKLSNRKDVVNKEWFSVIIDSYPLDTSDFLKNQKDPFANPVGQTTYESLSNVLEGLIHEVDNIKLGSFVDPIIRIRAVQSFKPSEALSFVFILKDIVRRCLGTKEIADDPEGVLLFDGRVDVLAIVAFDIYMACREQIYALKANESRRQFFSSLSRAGLIVET